MKALLIDAKKREIREVEYSPNGEEGLLTLRDHIGGWIEAAFRWENGDTMYVDEEGYLKPTMHFFFCAFRTDQPMAGNAIVVGREVEDDNVPGGYFTEDPTISAEQLKGKIAWMDRGSFDLWMYLHADKPAQTITSIDLDGNPTTEVLSTYGQLHAQMPKGEE